MPRQSEKRLLEFTFAEFSIKIPLILKYCNVISNLFYVLPLQNYSLIKFQRQGHHSKGTMVSIHSVTDLSSHANTSVVELIPIYLPRELRRI